MLPTVEQTHVARTSFPCRRVGARARQHTPALGGGALYFQVAAEVRSGRSMSFLSRRTWREVGAAGGSRRGRGSP